MRSSISVSAQPFTTCGVYPLLIKKNFRFSLHELDTSIEDMDYIIDENRIRRINHRITEIIVDHNECIEFSSFFYWFKIKQNNKYIK